MKRRVAILAAVVGLLSIHGVALGKPRGSSPPSAKRPTAAAAADANKRQAKAAQDQAKQARKQAQCLTSASHKVDQAARRVRWSRKPKERDQASAQLGKALRTLNGCYDVLFGSPEAPRPGPARANRQGARGHFGFGRIRVEQGSIRPSAVAHPLRRQAGQLHRCYTRALRRSPELDGMVEVEMRLERRARGSRVTSVALPQGTLGDTKVRRCLAETLMRMPFPAEGAGATVSLEMAFARDFSFD